METSRTVNAGKNITTGITNKLIMLVLTFVSRKIFINCIGVEYLGINSLFSNVLTILSLADMGFGIAMAYSYYKPLAEGDEDKLAALVQFYKRIYNIIAIVVAVIGVAVIPFLQYIINTETDIPHLYWYYLLSLANTVISYLFVYKTTIITADQKSYLINRLSIYITFSKVIIQIITMLAFGNYFIYALIDVLATASNNLIASYIANKYYPYINNKIPLSQDEKKSIFGNMKSVFIYKISSNIMSGTDSIIMSTVISTVAVGMYTNYLTITNQLTAFVQIFFSSFTAGIGNMVVEKHSDNNYSVFKIMQMLSHSISGIIAVCILLLMDDFISLWLGSEYIMGGGMAIAVAANTYFAVSLQPIWSYREATGLYNKTKYVMLTTAILNIILSVLFGLRFGAPGIIFATVVSRLMTYFWYEPYLVYKLYFKQRVWGYYSDFLISVCLIFCSYSILNTVFGFLIPQNSWITWIVKAVCSTIFVAIIFTIRYIRTVEFKACLSKVKLFLNK